MLRSLAFLALAAAPLQSQLTLDVGPDPAPVGSAVFASLTNDTDLIAGFGGREF